MTDNRLDDLLPAMTTFNSDSSSASLSSQRFDLDPSNSKPILVYKVREGCHICSQKELCDKLDQGTWFDGEQSASKSNSKSDPYAFKCSRVPIPKGASRVHVQTKDLWNSQERAKWSDLPNASSSVASVGLPRQVYWRRMMMGHFQTLYVVSPDHSPASSQNSTPENSQHVSPANTFNVAG